MDQSLLQNSWVSDEELEGLIDADKKNMLMTNLNKWYDGEVHTLVDLSMREVSGDKGSLCGMAAVYQALENTILTKSELKKLSYDDAKAAIAKEIEMDSKEAKKIKDAAILAAYFKCK